MNRDLLKGKLRNLTGRVKTAFGSLTGNRSVEGRGYVERGAGAVQEKFGQARHEVDRRTDDDVSRKVR